MNRYLLPIIALPFFIYTGVSCSSGPSKPKAKLTSSRSAIKAYLLERSERGQLKKEHHYLFLGIGKGCPGCSQRLILGAEEELAGDRKSSLIIFLRQHRRPSSLNWVDSLPNAYIETGHPLEKAWQELPFPLYLRTDQKGAIETLSPVKGHTDSVLKELGW